MAAEQRILNMRSKLIRFINDTKMSDCILQLSDTGRSGKKKKSPTIRMHKGFSLTSRWIKDTYTQGMCTRSQIPAAEFNKERNPQTYRF